jgi:hypothetical protein
MKFMTWLKLKFAMGAGSALLLAVGAAAVALSQSGGGHEITAQEIARQTRETYASLESYSDHGEAMAEVGGAKIRTEFDISMQRPNSYFIGWLQTTDARYSSRGRVWSAGHENFIILATAGHRETYQPQKVSQMQEALTMGAGASELASSTIPGLFFQENGGVLAAGRAPLKRERDERVDRVDCYVVTSALPEVAGKLGACSTMLWIGKTDHLIHRARTSLPAAFITRTSSQCTTVVVTETHENIAVNTENLSSYFAP